MKNLNLNNKKQVTTEEVQNIGASDVVCGTYKNSNRCYFVFFVTCPIYDDCQEMITVRRLPLVARECHGIDAAKVTVVMVFLIHAGLETFQILLRAKTHTS